MKKLGLVGFPLGHSFSKKFFEAKFEKLDLADHSYELFEMESATSFPALWLEHKELIGVNVTVPHKQKVLPYLDEQDASCIKVGAANVIARKKGKLIGYNTDYMAFRESLKNWIGIYDGEALILGSGGASKAVQAALTDLNIPFSQVSRSSRGGDYTYEDLKANPQVVGRFKLIINTTPLGTFPKVNELPDIPYSALSEDSYLYDLVYNPAQTAFMKAGQEHGAKTKNGQEMLELQAERSWEIWNS